MSTCHFCKKSTLLPFRCRRCGEYFCGLHQTPENHNCQGLPPRSWKNYFYELDRRMGRLTLPKEAKRSPSTNIPKYKLTPRSPRSYDVVFPSEKKPQIKIPGDPFTIAAWDPAAGRAFPGRVYTRRISGRSRTCGRTPIRVPAGIMIGLAG